MSKEKLASKTTTEKPTPPGVIFNARWIEGPKNKDGINMRLYDELTAWAVSEIPELQFPDTFQKVNLQISNMLSSFSADTANSLLELAQRHRPTIKSMLHGYVEKVQKEEMTSRTHH